jgi:2-oxo-3-hexenedioate decarboxylase
LENQTIEALAKRLHHARLNRKDIVPLAKEYAQLAIADAYAIQKKGIDLRIKDGERQVGLKMGLTSKAKREQMNLDAPVYGVLTDRMQCKQGEPLSVGEGIHPKIEPEIAFIIQKELKAPVSEEEVWQACSGVCAAMEILDSRYPGFQYFSLPDVIADNSSSYKFVLGKPEKSFLKKNLNISQLKMRFIINGQVVHEALSHVISGNPIQSVIQLCDLLQESGKTLPAGSIVLAGAATPAVSLEPGMQVELEVEGLPSVSLKMEA